MNDPLVTLCTPIYNHEPFLEDYFQSIINQTYQNIQLILIDDCSTDDSTKVVERWLERLEARFNSFVYIPRKVNMGLIYNCNDGLSLAEGKYFCIFASDDVMFPKNIEEKVNFLENNPEYAMVFSNTYAGMEPSEKKIKHFSSKTNPDAFHGDIFYELINYGCFIPAPSVVSKKEIIEEVGGYDNQYAFEDYVMWIKIAHKYKIGYINEPLVFYRFSPNSLSRSAESYEKLIQSTEKLLINVQVEYGVNTEIGLENLYSFAAISFFFKNNRTKYKEYRNKLKKKHPKIILLDIFKFLKIPPTFIRKVYKIVRRLD
jgi:alpha-1,3-rhamnosyltransferase